MRNPASLFSRYARQMLVDGVDLSGQMRLARAAVALAGDGGPFATAAAEATARYLVGAGIGTVACAAARAWDLAALDPEVHLLTRVSEARPPLANIYLACRPYGASVDILLVDHGAGWAEGLGRDARVASVRFEFSRPAAGVDAIIVGTAAADLVLGDLLGLAPLPAVRQVRWLARGAPKITDWESEAAAAAPPGGAAVGPRSGAVGAAILAELAADAGATAAILTAVEAAYPIEACGLLVRRTDGALAAVPCKNLQDLDHVQDPLASPRTARTAFRLDELEIARSAGRGETLVAIYHSHCDVGASFSAEDARCAAPLGEPLYPGVARLVVSVIGGVLRAARMFHFDADAGAWLAEPGSVTLRT